MSSPLHSKVLVVGMDGLRFDRLLALRPPVLTALMSTGVYGTASLPYGESDAPRTESPGEVVPELAEAHLDAAGRRVIRARTDSGPGWSSIASGVWPDKHGVVDNGFARAQFTKYPDFLSRAKAVRPELTTSALFSWAALDEHGAFGDGIDTKVVLDGYALTFAAADRQIAAEAERHLAGSDPDPDPDPDLTFVYLGDTDEVAHDLGPLCPEYAEALLVQDTFLGRFLDAVRARPSYADERWTVLVTTDHGHVDEGGHGGTSEQERTVFVIANRLGADLGGRSLGEARLVDVAPTALAALGIAVDPGWGLDGVPLTF